VLIQKLEIPVKGMHCANCAGKISRILNSCDGVKESVVNYSSENAIVTFDPTVVSLQKICRIINECGYYVPLRTIKDAGFEFRGETDAETKENADKWQLTERRWMAARIIVAFVFSIFLMIFMNIPVIGIHHNMLFQLLLSLPAFVFVSWPIFKTGFRDLLSRSLTMDVMYCLGIGTAFTASLMGMFNIVLTSEFIMFDTSIMLAGFLTLGRYLESRAKGRTSESIKKLIEQQPDTACVVRNGTESVISVDDVRTGDFVIVKPGERIAVDGEVIKGESSADESMISGESMPVVKSPGCMVKGGTINQSGVLTFIATRVGKDTMLSQIVNLVRSAQSSRPPVQKIADLAVAWFIPVILCIAVLTFVIWYYAAGATLFFSLTTMIAVLVIACPCALGLASPTAVIVGIGRGAELGILIKNGDVLEEISRVDTVVFDKTGTLTKGKPEVVEILAVNGSEEELLTLAVSLEKNANHPLADAIVRMADARKIQSIDVTDFKSDSGLGVQARLDNCIIMAGSMAYLEKNSTDCSAVGATVNSWYQSGRSVVAVAKNGIIHGIMAIADRIHEHAAGAVRQLNKMGMDTVILSGDNERAVSAVGLQIGIRKVIAGVLPESKYDEIKKLQQTGKKVAFVGDGINDAIALSQADVGIAIGNGSDIAIESGNIVLVKSDPLDCVAAIILGKKVFTRIKQNLFWAFAYNILLIPLAAGALYPFYGITFKPEFAAFAMALSSVTVVIMSLMLKGFRPQTE